MIVIFWLVEKFHFPNSTNKINVCDFSIILMGWFITFATYSSIPFPLGPRESQLRISFTPQCRIFLIESCSMYDLSSWSSDGVSERRTGLVPGWLVQMRMDTLRKGSRVEPLLNWQRPRNVNGLLYYYIPTSPTPDLKQTWLGFMDCARETGCPTLAFNSADV